MNIMTNRRFMNIQEFKNELNDFSKTNKTPYACFLTPFHYERLVDEIFEQHKRSNKCIPYEFNNKIITFLGVKLIEHNYVKDVHLVDEKLFNKMTKPHDTVAHYFGPHNFGTFSNPRYK
jgi:hypothetical protein